MSATTTLRTANKERTNAAIQRLALVLTKASPPTEKCVCICVCINCMDDPYTYDYYQMLLANNIVIVCDHVIPIRSTVSY